MKSASSSSSTSSLEDDVTTKLDKQVFLGFRYPNAKTPKQRMNALSEHEKAVLTHLGSVYQNAMHTVVPLPGNTENTFGSHAQVLHADAKIEGAITIPAKTFGNISMLRIPDSHISSQQLANVLKLQVANTLIENSQIHPAPSIATHFNSDAPRKDAALWSPSLNGGSLSAYSLPTSHGNKIHFIVVDSNVGPKICKELKSIANEEGMTAGKFAKDPRVLWTKRISTRNNRRLLTIAAKILCDPRDKKYLTFKTDLEDHTGHYAAPGITVVPHVSSSYNTFGVICENFSNTPKAVTFFDKCGDGSQSKLSTIVKGNQYDPIYEFQGKNHNNIHFSNGNSDISNKFYNIVPSHASMHDDTTRAHALNAISNATRENIASSMTSLSGKNVIDEHFAKYDNVDVQHIESNSKNYGLDSNIPTRRYNHVYSLVE